MSTGATVDQPRARDSRNARNHAATEIADRSGAHRRLARCAELPKVIAAPGAKVYAGSPVRVALSMIFSWRCQFAKTIPRPH